MKFEVKFRMETEENLTRQQIERMTMPEIIKSLRKLGGRSTTDKIKQDLLVRDNLIPEDYITAVKVSQKSGRSYRPFAFVFNFSISNLVIAGFVIRPERGEVELTKLGREVDLKQLDLDRDIYAKTDSEWERRHKENLTKKVARDSELVEEDVEEEWRTKLLTALLTISAAKFELFARLLVKAMGVDLDDRIGVKLTGDGGLDGYGYLTTDDFRTARVGIQAKRWTNPVSSPEIDKFRGAMDKHNAEFGIFITTSDFSREAITAARTGTRVITLINGDKLIDLVAKYQLHVKPVKTYELDDFFDDVD